MHAPIPKLGTVTPRSKNMYMTVSFSVSLSLFPSTFLLCGALLFGENIYIYIYIEGFDTD